MNYYAIFIHYMVACSALFQGICYCALAQLPLEKKDTTILFYDAGVNELSWFCRKNVDDRAKVGSNAQVNLVSQIHLLSADRKKRISKTFYIEKDNLIPLDEQASQSRDSGDIETFIEFCKTSIKNFPAHKYILIFGGHGSGILDISPYRWIDRSKLFTMNPETRLYELDRTLSYIELLEQIEDARGLCYDDLSNNFFNYQKFDYALRTICDECLEGKKFSIIGFDLCLMSMLEIAHLLQQYAHVMVASQEVEFGPGWPYDQTLVPLLTALPDHHTFAQHMVQAYYDAYAPITQDFTLAALNLEKVHLLEKNVDQVAQLLVQGMGQQTNNSVTTAIKMSRLAKICTHFHEPSYIDLHHFYQNLLHNSKNCATQDAQFCQTLQQLLTTGLQLIDEVVLANAVGQRLHKARGISIYFPERAMHHSYQKNYFAQNNSWNKFLMAYLQASW